MGIVSTGARARGCGDPSVWYARFYVKRPPGRVGVDPRTKSEAFVWYAHWFLVGVLAGRRGDDPIRDDPWKTTPEADFASAAAWDDGFAVGAEQRAARDAAREERGAA